MDILLFVVSISLANGFRRFIGGVCKEDRQIAVTYFSWVYGPLAIVCCIFLVAFFGMFQIFFLPDDFCEAHSALMDCREALIEYVEKDTIPGFRYSADMWMHALGVLISTSWALASAPIARLWAQSKAFDPDGFLRAEERVLLTRGQKAIEPHLSVPSYYSLLIGGFAVAFLILESVIGETFERIAGIGGYFGAIIAGLTLAGLFRPIKKRADAYSERLRKSAEVTDTDDIAAATREVAQSTGKLWLSILKDWPMVLIYMLLFLAAFFHVITYVLNE